jgi:hypothetical protein
MDAPTSFGRASSTMLSSIFLGSIAIAQSTQFEVPFRIRDARGFIDVDVGHAAPLVTDFDGDGVPDLLVGQFGEGKLRAYKNIGSAKAPRFDGFTWFKTGEQEGKVPSG